jgi:LmbE family N-acetylglucosaminyl deacetylase
MGQTSCVLAVGAHPDDVEIMCAGTLAILGGLGAEIHVATLTGGDGGSATLAPDQIRAVRLTEAEKACRLLGADYHFLGFDDFGIFLDDRSNRRVTGLVRDVDPNIVFTHPPQDYLTDHEITSRLVRNACFYGPVSNYDVSDFTARKRSSRIPHLFYAQPLEGIDLFGNRYTPHFYVNITSEFDLKEQMLACHSSQREWLRSHHGLDEYLDSMRRWCEQLGQEASELSGLPVRYAEAFRQHRGHAYPAENILRELLGQKVVA